jgi:Domain of unknown function (DUF4276)
VSVKIYVEGGGNQDRTKTLCRQGFTEYFSKIVPERRPRIVPAGSRREAYDDFCTALRSGGGGYDLLLLLVDSEDAIPIGYSAWQHLKQRDADSWDKPAGATDLQIHLMVRCMESWFLADKEVLGKFYGQGFLANSLPQALDVESVGKVELLKQLEHATKETKTKGKYHKVEHGFAILGMIDPNKVAAVSSHAAALHAVVSGG